MWISSQSLLLASSSARRAELLRRVGLPINVVAPEIDEELLRARVLERDPSAANAARYLAGAKAAAVSAQAPDAYVVGFDQTLEFEGECLSKPASLDDLGRRLQRFSGRSHRLHAGFALATQGRIVNAGVSSATMIVRPLSADLIAAYLAAVGPDALSTVGGYQSEGLGLHLFEAIEGDLFTVMGTPTIHVLRMLRDRGLVLA